MYVWHCLGDVCLCATTWGCTLSPDYPDTTLSYGDCKIYTSSSSCLLITTGIVVDVPVIVLVVGWLSEQGTAMLLATIEVLGKSYLMNQDVQDQYQSITQSCSLETLLTILSTFTSGDVVMIFFYVSL